MARISTELRWARIPQPTPFPDQVDSLDCVYMELDTGHTLELRVRRSDDALYLFLDRELLAWFDGRLLRSQEISTE